MRPSKNIGAIADEILAEVSHAERIKTAEVEAIRNIPRGYQTDIGQLLHKLAQDLRSVPAEVTYDDLRDCLRGQL